MSATRSLFNNPPDRFQPDAQRADPLVWVRRIVLLRSLEAVGEPIRAIELRRGLNIIATEQPDADDGPVGHNVGKTLFTRLIRYCLGESTFARERARKAIALAMPGAHVVAEVFVAGRCWIVARPIGEGRPADSWCLLADDWQAAITDQSAAQRYLNFQDALTEATVAPLVATLLPHENRAVRWQDLLAWLSRDQYCRYRDPLEWRNSATESGTAELHAEDASILIRLVMDLLDDDERRLIDEHKVLLAERAKKAATVATLSQELARTREFLGQRLKIDDDLLSIDLFAERAKQRANRRKQRLKDQLTELTEGAELRTLREDLDAARDRLTRVQHEIDLRQADRQTTEGELETHRAASRDHLLGDLADLAHPCPLPIGECPLKDSGQDSEDGNPLREALIREKLAAIHALDQVLAKLRDDLTTARAALATARGRYEQAEREQERKRRRVARSLSLIEAMIAEANAFTRAAAELSRLTGELAVTEHRLVESRESQRAAREQVAQNQRTLNGHFDAVVKALVGPAAVGRIDIDMRGLHLVFDEQDSSPGEAMATSGTVHSLDLACLRASIAGLGVMPRLLIHDSPREGDLEPHLYARLFRLADDLERAFGDRGPSFQYIVATTTPPPGELTGAPYVRLTLDARHVDGLLLKRRF